MQHLTVNLPHLKLGSSKVVLFTEHLGTLIGICGEEQARNVRISASFTVITQTYDEAAGPVNMF